MAQHGADWVQGAFPIVMRAYSWPKILRIILGWTQQGKSSTLNPQNRFERIIRTIATAPV